MLFMTYATPPPYAAMPCRYADDARHAMFLLMLMLAIRFSRAMLRYVAPYTPLMMLMLLRASASCQRASMLRYAMFAVDAMLLPHNIRLRYCCYYAAAMPLPPCCLLTP